MDSWLDRETNKRHFSGISAISTISISLLFCEILFGCFFFVFKFIYLIFLPQNQQKKKGLKKYLKMNVYHFWNSDSRCLIAKNFSTCWHKMKLSANTHSKSWYTMRQISTGISNITRKYLHKFCLFISVFLCLS